MAKITPDGIGKIYGGDPRAVRDLDLEIEDGEFLIQIYAREEPTANCARSQKHAD